MELLLSESEEESKDVVPVMMPSSIRIPQETYDALYREL